jgi:15-cis-phytoene synthase
MDSNASPEDLFRRNSRSFSLAARFFRPDDQIAVARLYRFCRYLDDLADDTTTGDEERLDLARQRLTEPHTAPVNSVEFDFNALSRERSIPLDPVLDLIDALRDDCGPCAVQDEVGLIRFAYGVAGTVGQMMRYVIDARDERADAFAIDLGIALQLSNVIRDVAEDAQRGRYYLPAAWVEPSVVREAMTGETSAIEAVDAAVRRAHDLAEAYYRSARRGFAYIPSRNRRVIFLAAAFYQAIGQKVVRKSPGGWRKRTVVGPFEKLAILLGAPVAYRRWKQYDWLSNPGPTHDAALHEALTPSNISG